MEISHKISEALKIVKKNNPSDPQSSPSKEPKQHASPRNRRPSNDLLVGSVDGIDVYKSFHSTQVRVGDKKSRDHGIKDALILKKIKNVLDTGELSPNEKTLIIYKNSKARYDLMIIIEENGYISIVTFMQEREKDPYNYFTKSRQRENKIIVENVEYPYIILDEEEFDEDTSWGSVVSMDGKLGYGYEKTVKYLLDNKVKIETYQVAKILATGDKKLIKTISKMKIDYMGDDNSLLKGMIISGQTDSIKIILPEIKKFSGKYDIFYELNSIVTRLNAAYDYKGTLDAVLSNKDALESIIKSIKDKNGYSGGDLTEYIEGFLKRKKLKKVGKFADLLRGK